MAGGRVDSFICQICIECQSWSRHSARRAVWNMLNNKHLFVLADNRHKDLATTMWRLNLLYIRELAMKPGTHAHSWMVRGWLSVQLQSQSHKALLSKIRTGLRTWWRAEHFSGITCVCRLLFPLADCLSQLPFLFDMPILISSIWELLWLIRSAGYSSWPHALRLFLRKTKININKTFCFSALQELLTNMRHNYCKLELKMHM